MQQLSLKPVLGVLGNVTSVALFLSPLPTLWSIYKLKSTQEFSSLPYVCTLFNCALWLLYGTPYVKPNSIIILTTNGIGFILEFFYLLCYMAFASRKKKIKTMWLTMAMCVALATVVVVTIVAVHTHSGRQLVAGTACVVLSVAMYASPLSVIGIVISSKSVECMPFLLSLFNLINALVWTAYSVFAKDIFVAIPNGTGSLFGIFQVGLYVVYRNSTKLSSKSTQLTETKTTEVAATECSSDKVQENLVGPTKASSQRFLSPQKVLPTAESLV
ncbi:hypothetical protein SUGI_0730010 [Cryptomeria japonica]|uniref:bidirectional sugar transporter SWEET5 n=1 Tax=Cryptomeria japonica TaxID=3369 RepID=UPI002414CFBE|nr:bidirectional sugar transporter SWEET5 [Cryptomeria japonica]GLJ36365.1 hypothetical protein SUGI_0730010 [Cryptomeria japonica]